MTLVLFAVGAALAHSAGMSGYSTVGCNCHGAGPSASTTAAFSASATTVEPGASVPLGFVVSTTAAARTYAGLDVGASGGTLAAGSNTAVMGGEITHSAVTALAAGTVTFDMTWTAPAVEGSYTLRGNGIAVNHDGNDGGDGWNSAGALTIVVDDGCEDADGDGYEACDDGTGADCDDTDAAIFPGTSESCDGVDNDCDGTVDESSAIDAETWYLDGDGDGWGLSTSFTVSCDAPAGYVGDDTDCDDGDAAVSPGATEVCDGLDDDCDGSVDPSTSADAATWFADADADGYAGTSSLSACEQPSGYLATSSDCDDALPAVNPGAVETCDGVDQDCDGSTDEAAADARTFYADADGDGFGIGTTTETACAASAGFVAYDGDCDDGDAAWHPGAAELCTDTQDFNCDGSVAAVDLDGDGFVACTECDDGDAAVFPGAVELCNGLDDDCDGTIDPDSAADAASWFVDVDGDGYGDGAAAPTISCVEPSGSVADASDCDDADATAYPGAPETCDHVDDDCDGVDDDSAVGEVSWYQDGDGDGFGDALSAVASCWEPAGYVADATDCDDSSSTVAPGATETCDGVDDDCDGTVDEPDAVDALTWYADADGDLYGDATVAAVACEAPGGFVADTLDCDDTAAGVHPGATEVWYDGVDDDCDGNDADADLDGWLVPADCADDDASVNPDAEDVFYDGVDADCAGNSDFDADADGYDSEAFGGTDCDDADPTTYVGAPDLGDGIEHDCDVRNDHDRDDDGYDDSAFGGNDCNDADSTVNPGADDAWYDGVDTDCDGGDDFDQDRDGVPLDADCDDTDRDVAADCDTGAPPDTGDSGDTHDSGVADKPATCSGCASAPPTATLGLLLLSLATLRRRR